jgi:LysM repeat protein
MKILKFTTVLIVTILTFTTGLALTNPALASSPDRSDNKVLISGVPQGWAIQVAQPGSDFPRGPGNLPDGTGLVMAYAPLGKLSQVYLWDKGTNAYYLIASIMPASTWPDTALSVPLQYAQGFPNRGLAAPITVNPGYPVNPGYYTAPLAPGYTAPSGSIQPGQQYVVRPGDTLFGIARQFGTTVGAVAAANNIPNPNLIVTGQVLTIPGR